MTASVPPRRPVRIYSIDLFRDIKKMILRSVVPIFLFMFAVSYISKERDTASDLGADFLYPHLSTYRYSTPSWKLNGSTAPCECRAEGKAVPSFYLQSNKHYSVMSYTEKNVCCGSVVSPSDTCSSHENARRNRLAAYRRLSRNFPIGALHPEKLFMFAVHSINEERNTASSLRADFLYPNLNQYGYSTPSSSVNAPTALREWNAEGKAVPSFYSPNKHNSGMHSTEKDGCRGSVVSPSDTCSSYENARLRLEFLRQSIMNWMETTIRAEFPDATKTRYRLRKQPRGRIVFHASVRSRGIYLHFRSHTLQGLSRQITSAAAIHRTHNYTPTI